MRPLAPVASAHISASGLGAILINFCSFLLLTFFFQGGGRIKVPTVGTRVQGYLLTYSRLQAPGGAWAKHL